MFKGCPSCLARGLPTNLTVVYDLQQIRKHFDPKRLEGRPQTIWRYAEFLPADPENAVSIGEGMTPLLPVPRLAKRLGIRNLLVKDESRNPTWSFKDRLRSRGVSMAKRLDASVIPGASSS